MPHRHSRRLVPIIGLLLTGHLALACCAGGTANPLRWLREAGSEAVIVVVRADSTWMGPQYAYLSDVHVVQQLCGPTLPLRLRLHAGNANISTGGTPLDVGRDYLIFNWQLYEGRLSSGGCDYLSGPTAGLGASRVEPATLRAYFSAIAGRASRELQLTYRDGKPLATGELRRGVPVGEWRYYDPRGVVEQVVDYDEVGTPEEVRTYARRGVSTDESESSLSEQTWFTSDSIVTHYYSDQGVTSAKTVVLGVTNVPGIDSYTITRHRGGGYQAAGSYLIAVGGGEGGRSAGRHTLERLELSETGDTIKFHTSWPGRDSARVVIRQADGSMLRRSVAHPGAEEFFGFGFHESGQPLAVMRLRDGYPEGLMTRFDEAGRVAERGRMSAGERLGIWVRVQDHEDVKTTYNMYGAAGRLERSRTYAGRDSTGRLLSDLTYGAGGIIAPSITYHDDGTVAFRVTALPDGRTKHERYHRSGQLASLEHKRDEHLEGVAKTYYPNGQLRARNHYIAGMKVGVQEYFLASGELERRGEMTPPTLSQPMGQWIVEE